MNRLLQWRTTALGVCVLLAALGSVGVAVLDGDPSTKPDFESIVAAVAGLGLLAAKDR